MAHLSKYAIKQKLRHLRDRAIEDANGTVDGNLLDVLFQRHLNSMPTAQMPKTQYERRVLEIHFLEHRYVRTTRPVTPSPIRTTTHDHQAS